MESFSSMYATRETDILPALNYQARVTEHHDGQIHGLHKRTTALEIDNQMTQKTLAQILTTLKVGFGGLMFVITIVGLLISALK